MLAELGAHQLDRPVFTTVTEDGKTALRSRSAVSIAVAGGVRRGRNWRAWTARRRELRAACAEAELRREAAAKELQALSASLAVAWTAVNDETAEVTRLTAEIGPLAEAVALARQRWGDHVPDGPAQAETEDAALIEWRETSAPWADEEYAASRAEVFLAALNLHKTLIAARADVFARNLGALMDLLGADPAAVPPPAEAEVAAADARGGGLDGGGLDGGGHCGRVAVALPGRARGPHAVRCHRAALRRPRADAARLAAGRSRRAAARMAAAQHPGTAEPRRPRGRHGRRPGKRRVGDGRGTASDARATTDRWPTTAPSQRTTTSTLTRATSRTDGDVNDRGAHSEPGAFNGTEDLERRERTADRRADGALRHLAACQSARFSRAG